MSLPNTFSCNKRQTNRKESTWRSQNALVWPLATSCSFRCQKKNHEFLYQVLQKMGFGPNFQAVYWTDTFFVKRGVRQGGPLSSLLFILALETLVCQIREKNIKGFLVNGKEIKTTLFADDMTCSWEIPIHTFNLWHLYKIMPDTQASV